MKRLLLGLVAAGIAMAAYVAWTESEPLPESPSRSASAGTAEAVDAADRPGAGNAGEQSAPAQTGSLDTGPNVREAIEPQQQQRGPDDIVVQVLDAWRRPIVGFPVALNPRRQLHDVSPDKRGVQRTDAHGLAVFRSFLSRRAKVSMATEPWFLVHDVCFEKQPFVRLDRQALSQDVIVSTQPPYGSLDIVARKADGSEPRNLDRAELSLVDPGEEDDPTLAWKRKRWSATLGADHRARFEFVELGRKCVGAVFRQGGETPSTAVGDGPVVAFERQQIDVVLDIDHAVAVFRAVDGLGIPLASTQLVLTVNKDWAWNGSKSVNIRTGADGRFAVDSNEMAVFGFVQHVCVKTAGDGGAIGFAEIPRRLKKGRTDCGDVVLRPSGSLASGQVVDERGQPVPGVCVRAGRHVFYRYPQGSAGLVWSFLNRSVEAITNDRGDFVLKGKIPYAQFKVWVDDTTVRSVGIDVKRRAKDVRLTCFKIFWPSVDVILADGVPWEGIEMRLWPAGQNKNAAGAEKTSREGNTVHVKMAGTPAGNYDLAWSFKRQPLGRQENLLIDADALIATIDLRKVIAAHEITLQPPAAQDPKTLGGMLLWQPSSGTTKDWQSIHFNKSPIRFNAPAATIDLRIYARGFREETLRKVSGPRTVALRPGLRVRLVLRTTGTIPAHPYLFGPWPCVAGKYVGKPVGSRYYTKNRREVTFLLPAGDIQVGWYLEHRRPALAVSNGVLDRYKTTIAVQESVGEQVFYLDLDGKALSDLMKKPW